MYNWKPIEYDGYKSVVYMTARMAANFAALKSVFHEVNYNLSPRMLRRFSQAYQIVSTGNTKFSFDLR